MCLNSKASKIQIFCLFVDISFKSAVPVGVTLQTTDQRFVCIYGQSACTAWLIIQPLQNKRSHLFTVLLNMCVCLRVRVIWRPDEDAMIGGEWRGEQQLCCCFFWFWGGGWRLWRGGPRTPTAAIKSLSKQEWRAGHQTSIGIKLSKINSYFERKRWEELSERGEKRGEEKQRKWERGHVEMWTHCSPK